MSELMEVFAANKKLSVTDRIVFYTTLSNNVNVKEDNLQDFLIETRIADGNTCIYCEGSRVVRTENVKTVYSVSFVVIVRSHLSRVPVLLRQVQEMFIRY